MILDAKGFILYSSDKDLKSGFFHNSIEADENLVKLVMAQDHFLQHFYINGQDYVIAIQSIPGANWKVILGSHHSNYSQPLKNLLENIIKISAVTLLFSMLLAYKFSQTISQPIVKLKNMASTISEGNLCARVDIESNDEIGVLSETFNQMAEDLQQYQQNIEGLVEERTKELNLAQSKLLDSAHKAGMAEVATGVIHNIGNINSTINATTERLISGLKTISAAPLLDVVTLMKQHKDTLDEFLCEDNRGQKVLPYMSLLLSEQNKQIDTLLQDAISLSRNMGHVNDIISVQQQYARGGGMILCCFDELVRDSMQILDAAIIERSITIASEFSFSQEVLVSRSQLIQIIVNVLKNAIESFDCFEQLERRICICGKIIKDVESGKEMVELSFADNGIGFKPELALKLFNYSFTTKEISSGTGYGLHFCANYLQSIGGNLIAQSDGLGAGATFTMLYPLVPKTGGQ